MYYIRAVLKSGKSGLIAKPGESRPAGAIWECQAMSAVERLRGNPRVESVELVEMKPGAARREPVVK